MPVPEDVTVSDRFSVPGGYKGTVGFTCSYDVDPDDEIPPTGPLYWAQIRRAHAATVGIWSDTVAGIDSVMQTLYGFGIPADSAAAMEQTRADAGC